MTYLLQNKYESPDLDKLVIAWLNLNYRDKGYGGLIKAVKQNPDTLKRLVSSGSLSPGVFEDLNSHV